MTSPLPIFILAGSDLRPGPVGPGLTADAMLAGYKGTLQLPTGRALVAELVNRIRNSERFADPLLVGPRDVYQNLVDCEIVEVTGTLAQTLMRVVEVLRQRFSPDQPVAISTCDILPSAEDLRQILDTAYAPHADCHFWWQVVSRAPEELGASSWKPHYELRAAAGAPRQVFFPGHLVILRPEAVRLEMLARLLMVAYRYRNWPLSQRLLPSLAHGLRLLAAQDLRNIRIGRFPVLTFSIPWHMFRAYLGVRNGTLSVPEFERHLARVTVHRRFRRGKRAFVVAVTRLMSFAKDIDTQAELEELARDETGGTARVGP